MATSRSVIFEVFAASSCLKSSAGIVVSAILSTAHRHYLAPEKYENGVKRRLDLFDGRTASCLLVPLLCDPRLLAQKSSLQVVMQATLISRLNS